MEEKDTEPTAGQKTGGPRPLDNILGALKKLDEQSPDKVTLGGRFNSIPRCPGCQAPTEKEFLICPECGFDLEHDPVKGPPGPVEKAISQNQEPLEPTRLAELKKHLSILLNGASGTFEPSDGSEKAHKAC